jgi:hypothetical protein
MADVPDRVRAAVEGHLGSPVLAAVNQRGGFSPGTAARVRCADGTRAFVKAVGAGLNPDSPRLHRTEGAVAAALPPEAPVPRLRFATTTATGWRWSSTRSPAGYRTSRGGPGSCAGC